MVKVSSREVEDEPLIARRLERVLREEAAEGALSRGGVDIVFLDLNLNGRAGFDLVGDAAAGAFHTVVASALTERALEAFEVGVLDFMGKPFGAERVHRSYLVRLDERVREGSRYAAVLVLGDEVPVGRTRVEADRARLILA